MTATEAAALHDDTACATACPFCRARDIKAAVAVAIAKERTAIFGVLEGLGRAATSHAAKVALYHAADAVRRRGQQGKDGVH